MFNVLTVNEVTKTVVYAAPNKFKTIQDAEEYIKIHCINNAKVVHCYLAPEIIDENFTWDTSPEIMKG